jgi:plastocyanin
MRNYRLLHLLLLFPLLLALAACSAGTGNEPAAAADDATHVHDDSHEHSESEDHTHDDAGDGDTHEHNAASPGPIAGAPEVRIVATEYGYEPSTITLTVDQPVNIVLVNEGHEEHEFTLGAFAFHLHTTPGVTAIGGLVPDKTGEFDFSCFLPGHAEAGMVGKVFVSDESGG